MRSSKEKNTTSDGGGGGGGGNPTDDIAIRRSRRRPRAAAAAAAAAAAVGVGVGVGGAAAAAAVVVLSDAAVCCLAYAPPSPPSDPSCGGRHPPPRPCRTRNAAPASPWSWSSPPPQQQQQQRRRRRHHSPHALTMVLSSEALKSERDAYRRKRREGSIVREDSGGGGGGGGVDLPDPDGAEDGAEDGPRSGIAAPPDAAADAAAAAAAADSDGPSPPSTTNTAADANNGGGGGARSPPTLGGGAKRSVGGGAAPERQDGGGAGAAAAAAAEESDPKKRGRSRAASAAAANRSILGESGLVRLQRAASAEIARRAGRRADGGGGGGGGGGAGGGGDGGRGQDGNDPRHWYELNGRLGRGGGSGGGSRSAASATAGEEERQRQHQQKSTSAIRSSWIRKAAMGPDGGHASGNKINDPSSSEPPTITLDQLNRAIDRRLNSLAYTNWDSPASQLPRIEGTLQPSLRDSMSSLLSYNHIRGDWRKHQSATTYNVAVVFGKKLVRDQITVEYASRIRTLARLFKDEPHFRPSLVCFTGCIRPGNHVSDADAGYIFFRHMCEAQGIDLGGVDVLIDSESTDEAEAVQRVTEGVEGVYVPKWLERSPDPPPATATATGMGGGSLLDGSKKVAVHFSLVSTEYHLCNLNDVHHRSPSQSLLKPIEVMSGDASGAGGGGRSSGGSGSGSGSGSGGGGASAANSRYGLIGGAFSPYSGAGRGRGEEEDDDVYYGGDAYDDDDDDDDADVPLRSRPRNGMRWGAAAAPLLSSSSSAARKSSTELLGVVETSWSFQYATYPFMYAQDDAVVFLGKCYLLAEELMPLLVNMKGVVEQKEFFQRDNYLMLASIRRSLVEKVERLHKRSSGLKRALKIYSNSAHTPQGAREGTSTKDIEAVLEGALLSLGRCVDLVRPAGLLVSSVSSENWSKALRALEHSMSWIRSVCDPDRPLRPTEWGKLVDDEAAMLDIGMQPRQHFVLWKDKHRRMMAGGEEEASTADEGEEEDDDDFFQGEGFSWALDE